MSSSRTKLGTTNKTLNALQLQSVTNTKLIEEIKRRLDSFTNLEVDNLIDTFMFEYEDREESKNASKLGKL